MSLIGRTQAAEWTVRNCGDNPAALYDRLLSYNGTVQSMVVRRLTSAQRDALETYAETQVQDILPGSNVNHVANLVRRSR